MTLRYYISDIFLVPAHSTLQRDPLQVIVCVPITDIPNPFVLTFIVLTHYDPVI